MNERAPKRHSSTRPASQITRPLTIAICVLIVTLFVVATVHARAPGGQVVVAPDPAALQQRQGGLTFELELPASHVTVLRAPDIASVKIAGTGYLPIGQEGMPDLPCRIVNILLPQGHEIDGFQFTPTGAQIVAANGIELPSCPPILTEGGRKGTGERMFSPEQVESPVYPPVLGKYLGTGYLHGYAIASFAVFPLRYEGGTLTVVEKIELRISTAADTNPPTIAKRKRLRPSVEKRVRSVVSRHVINPELLDLHDLNLKAVAKPRGGFNPTQHPSLEGSPVDYVIITSDALVSEYQRLADWKTAKGVPTVVRTIEWIRANCRNGVDLPETIRFFIREAYENWGIKFALLGGDSDLIPPRYAYSRYLNQNTHIPAEIYFACLDGSWNDTHDQYWGEPVYGGQPLDNPDFYAEVYVGRLPASTLTDAATMIDKTIAYETPLHTDFTDDVLLLAEVLFPPDWHEGEPINFDGGDISELLYNTVLADKPLEITRAYEAYTRHQGSVELTRRATIDWMDAGASIVNHVGHGSRFNFSCGDASVVSSDADALVNQDRVFMIFLADCFCSAFDYKCISEHLMLNPNGGAVATIGASHFEYPAVDVYYMNGFYDLIFNQEMYAIGEAFACSRLERTPFAEVGDNIDAWTHFVLTLLSDPEMPIWTGAAQPANVSHAANVGLGTNNIVVNVTSGGQPVDSAVVCLSKGDDDYQHGATNSLGEIAFDFTSESPGEIQVVVTGVNLVRYEGTITVDPSASAYVNYAGISTIDDDMVGGTFGNGDGVIDAGETVNLWLDMTNTGNASTTGTVTVFVTCTNPLVTVVDGTSFYDAIPPGATVSTTNKIQLAFDPSLADETTIEFELEISDGGTPTWTDKIRKLVHAPDLQLTTLRIDDGPPYGNGNGTNEANEEFLLYYGLKNFGTGAASGMTAVVTDLSGAFVIHDGTDSYPDLTPFVGGENVAGIHLEETSVATENDLEVVVTDLFGRVYRDTIELRVPFPPMDLFFDSSKGVDRMEVYWTKSPSPDVSRYYVYRSDVSGGPYVRASVDRLEHCVFLDEGLTPNTRYFYVVTAIDGSGNKSAYSPELSVSTNPPQLIGWPIKMEASTTSPPSVGDIDGDGDFEVVVGNQYVCAWHHDGYELRDGDGDPQTWGILATNGDVFTAATALAELDNRPGLDIIAADLNTKNVYCFDYNGNVLPGWPQSGENDFRAAPVAGDLNGDGLSEVVAIDTRGVVYAWKSNGDEYRDGDNNPSTPGVFYRTPTSAVHYQTPTLCDIDGDYRDEVVIGTRVDSIYVIHADSSYVPGWPFGMNGESAGSIAVGDVDNDGDIELLAQSKGQYGKVYLLERDGTVVDGWPRTVRLIDIFFTSSPALADFNNDGKLEAVVYGWNGTQSSLHVFDYQGNDYPGWPIVASNAYSEASPVVGDVNGDGVVEVIFGDEGRFIYGFDTNGQMVDGFPFATGDAVRAAPFIIDLDQNGDVEIVAQSWDRNVYVWDLSGTYNESLTPWPTYQANVHRNGRKGFAVATAVEPDPARYGPITRLELLQNYPNPFNPVTTIVFMVPDGGVRNASLKIYDVTGALIKTLIDGPVNGGRYDIRWDGTNNHGARVGTGVYFYRMTCEGMTDTKKMLLLK
ncbi:MAG: VCBS repeat-containing protein [Candidatus Latescibacterota bacterium]|nr:MAG: VCBS repeat-containing protein [Candidatus Latescibacterota bacterium]